jgi:putative flavoprotein involved in K+ transport
VLVVGVGNSGAEIAADLSQVAGQVWLAVRTPPGILRRERFGIPAQLLGLSTCALPPRVIDPVARAVRRLSVPDLTAYGLPAPPRPLSQYVSTGTVPVIDVGLVEALLAGRVQVVSVPERFDEAGVVLADAGRLEPNVVVAATGFRTGLEPLVGHLGVLDEPGVPRAVAPRQALPGMWFIGFRPALGGWLRRIAKDAPRLARAVASLSSTA